MGKGTQMKPVEQLLTTWYVGSFSSCLTVPSLAVVLVRELRLLRAFCCSCRLAVAKATA